MKYKGYIGHVSFDEDANIFHGEVIGLKDVITFQGKTPDEITQAFRDSVEDYLAWCKDRGEKPEKTYSGKFNVRISPEKHAELAVEAKRLGISLNDLVNQRLER